jgi:hypothetical protein
MAGAMTGKQDKIIRGSLQNKALSVLFFNQASYLVQVETGEIIIEREKVRVCPDEIHLLLGLNTDESDAHIRDMITMYIDTCTGIMEPRGAYITLKALSAGSGGTIRTADVSFHTGKTIAGMLKGSEFYHFFLATAGSGPEELSSLLIAKGDYLEGYIADLVGSAITESVASLIHEHISGEALARGNKVTNRYSPGFCGWDVGEQQKLFRLFPLGLCGISLSDSSLMSPIKSVSCVCGSGPAVSYKETICELCKKENCMFRRTRDLSPRSRQPGQTPSRN